MTHAVRRVEPADFTWAGPSEPAEAVRKVIEAAAQADGVSPVDEGALLALRHRGLTDSAMLMSENPAIGFAWVRDADLTVVVDPGSRGRGWGRAMAEAALGCADVSTAWSHGDHPAARRLAEALGFARGRELWVMRRPLSDLPPPAEPEGFAVRTFVPGRDEDEILALNAQAFARHPEQGKMSRADLEERMAEAWFDPEGFFLAESSDGRLVGFHWTKVHDGTPAVGEVYVVGVSPDAQGAGLGRVLTLTGLHHLAGRDLPEVLLYVESDNAPAVAVYSRLGFTHAATDTHVQYRRR